MHQLILLHCLIYLIAQNTFLFLLEHDSIDCNAIKMSILLIYVAPCIISRPKRTYRRSREIISFQRILEVVPRTYCCAIV